MRVLLAILLMLPMPAPAETGLGMSGQPVTRDTAELLGLGIPEGVVITGLDAGSPFARTGFEIGDVITAVEGVPVNATSELAYRMSVAQEADALVDYIRNGSRGSVLVSLSPPPPDLSPAIPQRAAPQRSVPQRADPPRASTGQDRTQDREPERDTVSPGMRLVRITPAVIAQYNLPPEATGVLVLDPGRLGERVGLRTGDVIRLINGTRVESARMVNAALSRSGRFRLAVLRGDSRIVLTFGT